MANILNSYPLDMNLISISWGGSLPDNKAITNGLGTILLNGLNFNHNLSNEPTNHLIINNFTTILDNPTETINNLIDANIITNDNGDLTDINNNIFINPSNYVNDTPCDDGNTQTTNDGICSGTLVANNTCIGGYTGDYNYNIYCSSQSLTDSNLDNYIGLTSVGTGLNLNNNQLTNVDGLSNLKTFKSLNLSYN